ncbi:hypothetical protein DL96DRAFT_1689575 [Flagelloscypha sp. PMI_526]|nr:hypothetical protein DL96DRAFT_1689575 [Flagelloscypha sp. PMI_526]
MTVKLFLFIIFTAFAVVNFATVTSDRNVARRDYTLDEDSNGAFNDLAGTIKYCPYCPPRTYCDKGCLAFGVGSDIFKNLCDAWSQALAVVNSAQVTSDHQVVRRIGILDKDFGFDFKSNDPNARTQFCPYCPPGAYCLVYCFDIDVGSDTFARKCNARNPAQ